MKARNLQLFQNNARQKREFNYGDGWKWAIENMDSDNVLDIQHRSSGDSDSDSDDEKTVRIKICNYVLVHFSL